MTVEKVLSFSPSARSRRNTSHFGGDALSPRKIKTVLVSFFNARLLMLVRSSISQYTYYHTRIKKSKLFCILSTKIIEIILPMLYNKRKKRPPCIFYGAFVKDKL